MLHITTSSRLKAILPVLTDEKKAILTELKKNLATVEQLHKDDKAYFDKFINIDRGYDLLAALLKLLVNSELLSPSDEDEVFTDDESEEEAPSVSPEEKYFTAIKRFNTDFSEESKPLLKTIELRKSLFSEKSFGLPDFLKFPTPIEETKDDKGKLSISGDLHGNGMKWFCDALKRGMITLPGEKDAQKFHFERLAEIYDQLSRPDSFSNSVLNKAIVDLNNILKNCHYDSTKGCDNKIGDTVADRGGYKDGGGNDFFNLILKKNLKQNGIRIRINWSNHDAELLFCYTALSLKELPKPTEFYSSLKNLIILKMRGLVSEKALKDLVQDYFTDVIPVGYIHNKEKNAFTLTLHAVAGLEIVEKYAAKYEIPYTETSEALKNTIQLITKRFSFDLFSGQLQKDHDEEFKKIREMKCGVTPFPAGFVINRSISNRACPDDAYLKSPLTLNKDGAHFFVVHGHDGALEFQYTQPNMISTDNVAGKYSMAGGEHADLQTEGEIGPKFEIKPLKLQQALLFKEIDKQCQYAIKSNNKLEGSIQSLYRAVRNNDLTDDEEKTVLKAIKFISDHIFKEYHKETEAKTVIDSYDKIIESIKKPLQDHFVNLKMNYKSYYYNYKEMMKQRQIMHKLSNKDASPPLVEDSPLPTNSKP